MKVPCHATTLLLAALPLAGRTLGEIIGQVVDAGGASVAAATITAATVDPNTPRNAVSNHAGVCRFPSLAPETHNKEVVAGGQAAKMVILE